MSYIYANIGANDVVSEFLKILRTPYEIEDLDKFYFQILKYYLSISNEMIKWYMRHEDHEFNDYQMSLQHETSSYGSNAINGIRNYVWYIRNDKKLQAESQRKIMLHNLYLFVIGVQSTEILYYEIFERRPK